MLKRKGKKTTNQIFAGLRFYIILRPACDWRLSRWVPCPFGFGDYLLSECRLTSKFNHTRVTCVTNNREIQKPIPYHRVQSISKHDFRPCRLFLRGLVQQLWRAGSVLKPACSIPVLVCRARCHSRLSTQLHGLSPPVSFFYYPAGEVANIAVISVTIPKVSTRLQAYLVPPLKPYSRQPGPPKLVAPSTCLIPLRPSCGSFWIANQNASAILAWDPSTAFPIHRLKVVHHVARPRCTYRFLVFQEKRFVKLRLAATLWNTASLSAFVDCLSDLLVFLQLQSDYQLSARRRLPDAGFGYDDSDEGLLPCITAPPLPTPNLISSVPLTQENHR